MAPIATGIDAITMGYGLKNLIIDGIPKNLQHTKFRLTDLRKCAPNVLTKIRKNGVVCGNVLQGRLCYGDVGSPLISMDTGRLIGIAISSNWQDCEVNRPQSFIGVSAYFKWIETIIFVFSQSQTRLDY